jgi:release factor glutamine methyltransferase
VFSVRSVVRFSEIKKLLDVAAAQLANSASARLDAEILLAHILKKPRAFLHGHPEYELSTTDKQDFNRLLQRRLNGEPVAYITGVQEFWSLPFSVNEHTLIPRPETELLVETALELANSVLTDAKPLRLLDMGTGSGCIVLALGHERPAWDITAIDISDAALQTAMRNARVLNIGNVVFRQSNWFSALPGETFDIIVSNPPYIAAGDPHLHGDGVVFEPQTALVAQNKGLADIRHIVENAREYLNLEGWLLFEIGHDQATPSEILMRSAGYRDVACKTDLAGIPRICLGQNAA